MTVKLGMRVFWNHSPIPVTTRKNARLAMTVPFGTVMNLGGDGSGGAVNSVNNKTPINGNVDITYIDVGADSAGSAASVRDDLEPQIEANATGLNSKADAVATSQALASKANAATVNQQLALKASQIALDATNQQVATNTQELTQKADLTALAMLTALLGTKADEQYVNEQIGLLVNGDQNIIATIQAISAALEEYEDLLEALDYTVANRVRFDIATQGLNALQKYNARTNISAEEAGTAALLIQQITVASIGAATAAQGAKADSAVQPEQLKPVATTGAFSDLTGKSGIYGIVYTGYAVGANLALAATDSLGTMLGKLQGQIDAVLTALSGKEPSITAGTVAQYLRGDKTWQTLTVPDKAWVDLVVQAGSGHVSGFADGTNKLQIAKENGYIYIRGVVRNTLGVSSNNLYANLSAAYMVKQPNQVSYIASPAIVINLNSTAAPVFLATYQTSATVQTISKSNNGSFEANGIFFIAPAVLGIAVNP